MALAENGPTRLPPANNLDVGELYVIDLGYEPGLCELKEMKLEQAFEHSDIRLFNWWEEWERKRRG